jgi:tRNA(Arg) A34 adenosine deaminase TadA
MATKSNLDRYWNSPVSALATVRHAKLTPAEAERHRLYSLGLMALVQHYWNGLKKGRDGEYPLNPPSDAGPYMRDNYLGHNIAALAVDRRGNVIDFEFNHNRLFNSSAEHAESRLVRRIYGLSQISDIWDLQGDALPATDDYTTFGDVTLYTSLESCSQCSGVMALARVRQVVFLQTDPGMYRIGNIIYNLTRNTGLEAPRPVPGRRIGLPYFDRLDTGLAAFVRDLQSEPFYRWRDKEDRSPSVTSFLCTQRAYEIYSHAAAAFWKMTPEDLAHPMDHGTDRLGAVVSEGLTNRDVLNEVRNFLEYATVKAHRGTPHRS